VLFSVSVGDVPPGDKPTLQWSLAPSGGPACENPSYPGATLSRNGLVVWDEQGPTFRWLLGRGARCTGKVSVLAENQYEHCTATVAVTPTGTRSEKPACALGGYAIGFSTLPVPAGVFRAVDRMRAVLAAPQATATAAAAAIRKALREESASLALFPPVWFCDFAKTFAPIAALRADLLLGKRQAARQDARAGGGVLARCAPAPVRRAFAQLAASPQTALLAATLGRYFPTVFGFRFDDLVNRIATEDVALHQAEAAAVAGNAKTAAAGIAAAGKVVQAVSARLDRYQRGVEHVENAHG